MNEQLSRLLTSIHIQMIVEVERVFFFVWFSGCFFVPFFQLACLVFLFLVFGF